VTHAEHAREVWSMLVEPVPLPPHMGLDMMMERTNLERGRALQLLREAASESLVRTNTNSWNWTPDAARNYFACGAYPDALAKVDFIRHGEHRRPDVATFGWLAWCNLVAEAVAVMRELEAIP
jgi:hypothetical protein